MTRLIVDFNAGGHHATYIANLIREGCTGPFLISTDIRNELEPGILDTTGLVLRHVATKGHDSKSQISALIDHLETHKEITSVIHLTIDEVFGAILRRLPRLIGRPRRHMSGVWLQSNFFYKRRDDLKGRIKFAFFLMCLVTYLMIARHAKLFFLNEELAEYLQAKVPFLKNQIHACPDPVDSSVSQMGLVQPPNNVIPTVLFLGKHSTRKGTYWAINSILDDWETPLHLLIAGDISGDPLLASLQARSHPFVTMEWLDRRLSESEIIECFIIISDLLQPTWAETFLERMLAAHPQIAAEGESWSLLPLLYGTRRIGLSAEYGHQTYVNALSDLCTAAGKTTELYDNAVRAFAEELYRPLCGEKAVFVDKTPRYGLAIDELNRIFPDAPMIFLWRNPLSVIASMVTTWHGGRWRLGGNYIDLLEAYPRLIDGYEPQNPRHLSLRYEDLVLDPRSSLHKVLRHLELPYDDAMLSDFTRVNFPGRYGDPTGVKDYQKVSDQSLGKWRDVLAGAVRKKWVKRYVSKSLGPSRLEKIGYDYKTLVSEVDEQPSQLRGVLGDLCGQWASGIEYRLKRFKWGYHWRP